MNALAQQVSDAQKILDETHPKMGGTGKALAAANERVRELEAENKSMEEHIHRIGSMYAKQGDTLAAERAVSDKLVKVLEGIMFCAPENSTIETQAIAALAEVEALRQENKE